jgi:hypothetical protein
MSNQKSEPIARSNKFFTGSISSALREFIQPRVILEIPRLLREGMGPVNRLVIQARNASEIARLLKRGTRLNFVSSFPRSGNTWMRYLLTDVLLQNSGVQTTTELTVPPGRVVPDFYCDLMSACERSVPTPGVFVKTHDVFDRLEEKFGRLPSPASNGVPLAHNCKHLYLYRAPEDSLISLFHYFDRHRYFKQQSVSGPDEFCLARLDAWERNLSSYLRAAERGVPIFFVNYEILVKEPSGVLGDILGWLDIPHDPAVVRRAVLNMQFTKLRELEVRERLTEEAVSLRRGASGAGRDELKPETVKVIHGRTSELMDRALALVLKQRSVGGGGHSPGRSSPPTEKFRGGRINPVPA